MSQIWQHASKRNPCPICGREDWCQFGDRAMKCMRAESSKPCPSGGWYHFYDEKTRIDFIPKSKPPPRSMPVEAIMESLRADTRFGQLEAYAVTLGVTATALREIGAAWYPEKNAWAFPMHDGESRIIGIRLRNSQGFKWALTGSRNGLFVPNDVVGEPKVAYLPEGPTNTAAMLSLGLFTIGRPTCTTGGEMISQLLKQLRIFRAVIVADNDDVKRLGNRDGRPGIEGAMKLKKELKIPTVIWMPPSPLNDARDFLRAGGTKQQIESEIRNKIWTK